MSLDHEDFWMQIQSLIDQKKREEYAAKICVPTEVMKLARFVWMKNRVGARCDKFFIETKHNRVVHLALVLMGFVDIPNEDPSTITLSDRAMWSIELRSYTFDFLRQANNLANNTCDFFQTLLDREDCLEAVVPYDQPLFQDWMLRYFIHGEADLEGLTANTYRKLCICSASDHKCQEDFELQSRQDIIKVLAEHPWEGLKQFSYVRDYHMGHVVIVTVPGEMFAMSDFAEFVFVIKTTALRELLGDRVSSSSNLTEILWCVERMTGEERYQLFKDAIQHKYVILGTFNTI